MTRLRIKVIPGASRSELAGWLGDMLKVRITAQPEKGKANAAVLALLACELGISKNSLGISAGATSRQKVVDIQGLSIAQIKRALGASDT